MLAGMNHRVYLELGPKKVFACSIDWPGWCRIGRTEEAALDTLVDYTPRFRTIAERAGLEFTPGDPAVVERVRGDRTTDFGAISAIPDFDREPVEAPEAARAVALARAAWAVLAEVAAASPRSCARAPGAAAGTGTRWSPTSWRPSARTPARSACGTSPSRTRPA
ncbi:hypothetical protein GCM10027612_55630 [Microbispora bryophytorum subsp. camponoti]